MKIGFIGLGHMGNPMVKNLLKSGFAVEVYDVMPEAMSAVVSAGAVSANSVSELANDCEVIFIMVQTGEQVSEICLTKGLFQHAKKNTLIIDASSIDVETSRGLHKKAIEFGLVMVDAPVSGGVAGATAGTLTIMVGGEEEAFKRAQPFLSVLGKNVIHAGAAGAGQAAKICNNMILGISMIAVSEAFVLAEKLGFAPEKLFEISSKSSGQCWSLTSYCPYPGLVAGVPSNNKYQAGFTAQMMLKDLRLSQKAAESAMAATALGAEATMLYEEFVHEGFGNLDFSGIIRMIQGRKTART